MVCIPKVTIRDVAKSCGVSITTVSRVLGNSDYPVNCETRTKVIETAQKLGYTPNMLARALKSNVSNEIAVAIPSVQNLFYTSLVTSIEKTIYKAGFNMLLYIIDNDTRRKRSFIDSIRGKRIAGLAIAADCVDDEVAEQLEIIKNEYNVKIIFMDYEFSGSNKSAGVYFNYVKGAELSAKFLVDNGHKNIAFASSALDRTSRKTRIVGFSNYMKAENLEFSSDDIFICTDAVNDFSIGIALSKKIVSSSKKYTAIAVINDSVAIGVLAGLSQQNIRVPQDISVIGFDDSLFSEMSMPMLTTVRVPAATMGKLAAEYILQELNKVGADYNVYMKPEVIVRGTVKKIN